MIAKKITSITPNGNPWGEPPNGPLYPFKLEFEDGMRGVANSKSQTPPYKVGDTVGVEVTGQDARGNNKLKIDRKWPQNNQGAGGSAFVPTSSQNPVKPQETASNAGAATMINGQTVGMAIGRAVDVLKIADYPSAQIFDGTFVQDVYELASQIIRISYKLEHGKLAQPKVVQPETVKQAMEQARAVGFKPQEDTDGPPF